jgi:hypothetical protein
MEVDLNVRWAPPCAYCHRDTVYGCTFCNRNLCRQHWSPIGNGCIDNICIDCGKQIRSLRVRMGTILKTFLRNDPTSIVVSYFCPRDVMKLSPLWGFLIIKLFDIEMYRRPGDRIRVMKNYGWYVLSQPQCDCWIIDQPLCHDSRPKWERIRYNPRLYHDKPDVMLVYDDLDAARCTKKKIYFGTKF